MKMKGRKALAFWVINIELLLIILLVAVLAKDMLSSIGVTCVIMLVGNGLTFVGGTVADAWQKSKYYNKALDFDNFPQVTTVIGPDKINLDRVARMIGDKPEVKPISRGAEDPGDGQ